MALGSLGLMAVTAWAQVQTYNCPGGFQRVIAAPVPAVLMSSLQKVPNPVIPKDPVTGAPLIRADLADYVANLSVAIRLPSPAPLARPGCWRQPHGGTLFLDEVTEMSPSMQVKLLRVIQEK